MNRGRQLGDLPVEIHQFIFSFLNFRDMDHMGGVSKYWHKLAKDVITKTRYSWLRDKIPRLASVQRKLDLKITKLQDRHAKEIDNDWIYYRLLIVAMISGVVGVFAPLILYLTVGGRAAMIMVFISPTCCAIAPFIYIPLVIMIRGNRIRNQIQVYEDHTVQLAQKKDLFWKELKDLRQNKIEV